MAVHVTLAQIKGKSMMYDPLSPVVDSVMGRATKTAREALNTAQERTLQTIAGIAQGDRTFHQGSHTAIAERTIELRDAFTQIGFEGERADRAAITTMKDIEQAYNHLTANSQKETKRESWSK